MSVTLTEFLLARIAEDEAPTFELVPYGCGSWCCAPPGWVGHRCLICDTPAEFGGTVAAITEIAREHEEQVHRRARVLAECEAKRRIIHECSPVKLEDFDESAGTLARIILSNLAAIHADHPDYDEGWRR